MTKTVTKAIVKIRLMMPTTRFACAAAFAAAALALATRFIRWKLR